MCTVGKNYIKHSIVMVQRSDRVITRLEDSGPCPVHVATVTEDLPRTLTNSVDLN